MSRLCVIQHTEAEYLSFIEDHFEGRGIRFDYFRPLASSGGVLPKDAGDYDGLVVLGAGPFGVVSSHLLPSFGAELRLVKDFLNKNLPVVGIGFGAILLAIAAGGGAEEAPLRFEIKTAKRTNDDVLCGWMPKNFPVALYLRDRPVLPEGARVEAACGDEPLVFSIAGNCLGFLGHPGVKSALIEDLVMEFTESPDDIAEGLEQLRREQAAIVAALSDLMTGLVAVTGWMDKNSAKSW